MSPARTTARAASTTVFIFSLLGLLAGAARAETASAGNPCEAQMAAAAQRYDVPLAVFYAVGLLETGGRNGLRPFTMNIEGRSSFNDTLAAALAAFAEARRKGARLIDVGCMQINYRWHGDQFASVEQMFDPAHNVDYAARFLRELKAREGTWTLAVARYNAGPNNNAAQKTYVCGVIRRMVTSGFGSWTDSARAFCGEPAAQDRARPRRAPRRSVRRSASSREHRARPDSTAKPSMIPTTSSMKPITSNNSRSASESLPTAATWIKLTLCNLFLGITGVGQ